MDTVIWLFLSEQKEKPLKNDFRYPNYFQYMRSMNKNGFCLYNKNFK